MNSWLAEARLGMVSPMEDVDLRGIRCPMSWVHAKARLEKAERGAVFAFRLDDPRGARDVPRAAEAAGYHVLDAEEHADGWRIVITR